MSATDSLHLSDTTRIISDRIPASGYQAPDREPEKGGGCDTDTYEDHRNYEELGGKAPLWQDFHEISPYWPVPQTIPVICDLNDVEIYADPMIEKVFYNLFDNSFRYRGKDKRHKNFLKKYT